MSASEITEIKVSHLCHDPDNVNQHGEQNIGYIKASIQKFGFLDPIGVVRHPSKRGAFMIVEGHGRHIAAQELGLDAVPCMVLSLDDATRRGYSIAHNQTQQISSMNNEVIAAELSRLGVTEDDYPALGLTQEDVLFHMSVAPSGDQFGAPGGGDYQEGEVIPDGRTGADIGADKQAWGGFIPPVHRTTLRFASETSYNRFVHLLAELRDRYPTAGTGAERMMQLLHDINAVPVEEAASVDG